MSMINKIFFSFSSSKSGGGAEIGIIWGLGCSLVGRDMSDGGTTFRCGFSIKVML